MTPEQPKKQGMGVGAIIAIIAGVVLFGCCIFGTLAAIAVPNFLKFQARSKQSECKSRLKAAYVAERSWFAEKDQYTEDAAQAAIIDDGTRSVVLLSRSAAPLGRVKSPQPLVDAINERVPAGVGITGQCPNCQMTIGCALNADNDPEIDVWSISTQDRVGARGQSIPAGMPYNDFNDVTDSPGD